MTDLETQTETLAQTSHSSTIDTMRAIAIFCVLAHHIFSYTGYEIPYLDRNGGLIGVQLFFLISGYLIIQSALKYSLRVFLIHRFFRIFPPYLVALLVFASLKYLTDGGYKAIMNERWPFFFLNVFNLQFMHPVSVLLLDPIHVGWSLTVELFWYALAPVLVYVIGKDTTKYLDWLVALVIAAMLSTAWVYWASHGLLNPLYERAFWFTRVTTDNAGLRHAVIDNAPPAQMAYFIMGAALFVFRSQLMRVPTPILWTTFSAILLFVPQWNQFLGLFPNILTGIGCAALFLWIRRFSICDKFTQWLAKVSYSIYLIHVPVLLWVFKYWNLTGLTGLLVAVLFITVLAEISWRLIEFPSQRWGKRLGEGIRVSPH